MPKIIIKNVADDSIEDELCYIDLEQAEQSEKEINVYLDKSKYKTELHKEN